MAFGVFVLTTGLIICQRGSGFLDLAIAATFG